MASRDDGIWSEWNRVETNGWNIWSSHVKSPFLKESIYKWRMGKEVEAMSQEGSVA